MKIKLLGLILIACSIFSCKKDQEVTILEVKELRFCSTVASDNLCSGNTSVFTEGISEIFASVKVSSTPGKQVTFDWYYEGQYLGGETVQTIKVGSETEFWANAFINSNSGPLPAGIYEVDAALEGGNSLTRSFEIR